MCVQHRTCGSWLACDADGAVCQARRGDAIASKPALTDTPAYVSNTRPVGAGLPAMQTTRSVRHIAGMPSRASPLPQTIQLLCLTQDLWELACLRCRRRGLPGTSRGCHREQARSHRHSRICVQHRTCRSWLACDAGDAVCQVHRGDAIASKPAPTDNPAFVSNTRPVGAGLPAMQTTRSARHIASKPAPTEAGIELICSVQASVRRAQGVSTRPFQPPVPWLQSTASADPPSAPGPRTPGPAGEIR